MLNLYYVYPRLLSVVVTQVIQTCCNCLLFALVFHQPKHSRGVENIRDALVGCFPPALCGNWRSLSSWCNPHGALACRRLKHLLPMMFLYIDSPWFPRIPQLLILARVNTYSYQCLWHLTLLFDLGFSKGFWVRSIGLRRLLGKFFRNMICEIWASKSHTSNFKSRVQWFLEYGTWKKTANQLL